MVDTKQAMESKYVSVELVKESPTKKLVVIDGGRYEEDMNKDMRLTLNVNMDGGTKIWRPNRDTVINLQVYGADSQAWVGKTVDLEIISVNGQKRVIGKPVLEAAANTPITSSPEAKGESQAPLTGQEA